MGLKSLGRVSMTRRDVSSPKVYQPHTMRGKGMYLGFYLAAHQPIGKQLETDVEFMAIC